jgi:hypothetical protein
MQIGGSACGNKEGTNQGRQSLDLQVTHLRGVFMLIVGGGAALVAITIWLGWVAVNALRASWRARQAEKRAAVRERERGHAAHAEAHPAPGE